jgi:hypothetical protein
LTGPHEVRLAAALSACVDLLACGWQLARRYPQANADHPA